MDMHREESCPPADVLEFWCERLSFDSGRQELELFRLLVVLELLTAARTGNPL